MQPLIDSDVLLYEIGFGGQMEKNEEGEPIPLPFDQVADMLDNRINYICAQVDATLPPILYITGKGNFREQIAKRQQYKERPGIRPFHYYNLKAYMKGKYNVIESVGMEADDLMAIEQTSRPNETIICTRDKDLRQVPGWHYGWEVHNQPSFGPELVTEDGSVELVQTKSGKKLKGTGRMFFLAQLLMGDPVDTVPGLGNRTGDVKAFKILEGCSTYQEGLKAVYRAYKEVWGLLAYKEMLEQGRLLWMVRECLPDGSPKMWGMK